MKRTKFHQFIRKQFELGIVIYNNNVIKYSKKKSKLICESDIFLSLTLSDAALAPAVKLQTWTKCFIKIK